MGEIGSPGLQPRSCPIRLSPFSCIDARTIGTSLPNMLIKLALRLGRTSFNRFLPGWFLEIDFAESPSHRGVLSKFRENPTSGRWATRKMETRNLPVMQLDRRHSPRTARDVRGVGNRSQRTPATVPTSLEPRFVYENKPPLHFRDSKGEWISDAFRNI
ncbi:hypothetical protein AVEN_141143-1 [Araneus ventricosus]|uniref:Uncharacterized protein n=1 Tax=Araneus ventricosus TaxID=182803 RepID=A0A4Y2FMN1_ARAVE|nr:hypothetical protein AVEN_141143-1 [Araneus ventricosus]